jgi:hypothetical protein
MRCMESIGSLSSTQHSATVSALRYYVDTPTLFNIHLNTLPSLRRFLKRHLPLVLCGFVTRSYTYVCLVCSTCGVCPAHFMLLDLLSVLLINCGIFGWRSRLMSTVPVSSCEYWDFVYRLYIFFLCTVHFEIYVVHSPTNTLFINLVKSFKFTLKYTIISRYYCVF